VPSSLLGVRLELDRLLAGRSVPPARMDDIRLAVTEACANAVVHAYPAGEGGTVRVTANVTPETLVVAVRDYGPGFGAHPSTIGLDMLLMRTLADSVLIDDADPGAAVRMAFHLEQRPGLTRTRASHPRLRRPSRRLVSCGSCFRRRQNGGAHDEPRGDDPASGRCVPGGAGAARGTGR
jgi:anti-sigma regulatory factor (Ser/Thr protein kinase)